MSWNKTLLFLELKDSLHPTSFLTEDLQQVHWLLIKTPEWYLSYSEFSFSNTTRYNRKRKKINFKKNKTSVIVNLFPLSYSKKHCKINFKLSIIPGNKNWKNASCIKKWKLKLIFKDYYYSISSSKLCIIKKEEMHTISDSWNPLISNFILRCYQVKHKFLKDNL